MIWLMIQLSLVGQGGGSSHVKKIIWDFEKLKLYLNHVRSFEPELTEDANSVIVKYYQLQRAASDRNQARTTVRMLESVIRLSQAHAKLMYRQEVLVMDAVVAITLMECSLSKTSFFGDVNILHTSFPEDPEVEYFKQAELILDRLELRQLLQKELGFIRENYEPYNKPSEHSEPKNQQPIHNFDIISQMVADIPTQPPSSNYLFSSSVAAATSPMEKPAQEGNSSLLKKRKLELIREETLEATETAAIKPSLDLSRTEARPSSPQRRRVDFSEAPSLKRSTQSVAVSQPSVSHLNFEDVDFTCPDLDD